MIPRFKTYLEIARAEFLVFSFVVASVPVSLSIATGGFDLTNTVLATVLLVASHVAVNSINVASDYRRGIDEDTEETPFSGGVDTLTSGRADYTTARNIGVAFSVISFAVMVFFVQSYGVFPIGIVFLIGLVLVLGYTDVFTRVGLGETSCGLGLGALPTVGIFYVQSGNMTQEAPACLCTHVLSLFQPPSFQRVSGYRGRRSERTYERTHSLRPKSSRIPLYFRCGRNHCIYHRTIHLRFPSNRLFCGFPGTVSLPSGKRTHHGSEYRSNRK